MLSQPLVVARHVSNPSHCRRAPPVTALEISGNKPIPKPDGEVYEVDHGTMVILPLSRDCFNKRLKKGLALPLLGTFIIGKLLLYAQSTIPQSYAIADADRCRLYTA